MNAFRDKLKAHVLHVASVGQHCNTEETTKQALILPLLETLGFHPYDPTKVKAEYGADFPGVKVGERVDYALFVMLFPSCSSRRSLSIKICQIIAPNYLVILMRHRRSRFLQ